MNWLSESYQPAIASGANTKGTRRSSNLILGIHLSVSCSWLEQNSQPPVEHVMRQTEAEFTGERKKEKKGGRVFVSVALLWSRRERCWAHMWSTTQHFIPHKHYTRVSSSEGIQLQTKRPEKESQGAACPDFLPTPPPAILHFLQISVTHRFI